MTTYSPSAPIVIIGTGLGGYNLAKELRKLDPSVEMVLITQDDGHFYSKPQLSNALMLGKTPENLIITPMTGMQAQLKATIYAASTVYAIDTASRQIRLSTPQGQISLEYSQCVFALGATPKPLPLLAQDPNHFRVNNLQDYTAFIQAIPKFSELVIVGSGLVGCEFAHDLSEKVAIHLVTPQPYPLAGLVPKPVGDALMQTLSAKGVKWYTNTELAGSHLTNGEGIKTRGILSAIGLQPQIALAQAAGIKVNQGIVVDEFLQTNIKEVYALGDCAEIAGACRQFVAPLLQCARALALTLTGKLTKVALPISPIALKVNAFPMIMVPPPLGKGEWEIKQDGNDIKALCYHSSHLQGYVLTGNYLSERQAYMQKIQMPTDLKSLA